MNDYAAINPVMPTHRLEPRLTRDKHSTNAPLQQVKDDEDDDQWQAMYMQALESWRGKTLDVSAKYRLTKRHP